MTENQKFSDKPIEMSFFYRYCLVVENENSSLNNYLISTLRENKFDVQVVEKDEKQLLLLSMTDEKKIFLEAQLRKVRKQTIQAIPEKSEINKKVLVEENKRPYTTLSPDNFRPDEYYNEFYSLIDKKPNERWGLGLFTEAEMLYLEKSILCEIVINTKDFAEIYFKSDIKHKHEDLNKDSIENFLQSENRLFYIYEHLHLFEETFPIHNSNFKDSISKVSLLSLKSTSGFNVDRYRNYLGDYMAIYFYWLDHYSSNFLFKTGLHFLRYFQSDFLS